MKLTFDQAKQLLSRQRAEIMQFLNQRGESIAADLALHLGVPEKSVYYHLRVLEGSGMISSSEKRQGNTKPQTVFRSLVNPIRLEIDRDDPALAALAEKKVKTLLRRLQTDYKAALSHGTPRTPIVIQSASFRLVPADRDELQRRMHELVQWADGRESSDGESFSYTSMLLPLQRSNTQKR